MNDSNHDLMTVDNGTVAMLNKGEIDMQIGTAHKYPRSIKKFRDEVLQMVTLNEKVAQECIYSLPRGGKSIEGPSVRFAEVAASAWGNSRAGARVVGDDGRFITAQAVFHDLERNVAITYEVQRRVTGKNGARFADDMIGVTGNAACSIALRNAILKGIPKAFWSDLYDQARETAIGNVQTLANRRARALGVLQKMGVPGETVFAYLHVAGIEDITLEHLATLFGITTAIKEGDTTPELAFTVEDVVGKPAVKMPTTRKRGEPDAPHAETVDQGTGEITSNAEAKPEVTDVDVPDPALTKVKPETLGNTLLATEGEKKMIATRAKNNNIDMLDLLANAGMGDFPVDLSGLTKDGFIALREALPKAS